MAIEVVSTSVSESEIASDIKIDFPPGLTQAQKNKIRKEAGELIIDHILGRVSKAKSPIKGEGWPVLSREYQKLKKAQGRGGKANLEFNGDMLDALGFKNTEEGIRLRIKGIEAPKADGHNNFSGRSTLPTRQFLPKEGDKFTGSVDKDVVSIIADEVAKKKRIKKSDLPFISSKRELNELIREEFPGIPLSQAKDAILFDDDLRNAFSDYLDFF